MRPIQQGERNKQDSYNTIAKKKMKHQDELNKLHVDRTKNWRQNIKTEARLTIYKGKNLTQRLKVCKQWATNELENYT